VKVYVVQNPLSFHARAFPVSQAAYAAHLQGKYEEYAKILWENMGALEDADLEKYAKDAGLDLEKWKKDKDSEQVKGWLKNNQAMAAALGASGTPAFFINGEFLSGAQDFEKFKVIIDKNIEKANKLLEKKVPAEALHAVLTGTAVQGKYRRFVIDGKPAPAVQAQGEEGEKEPFAKVVAELAIGDSPRKGHGDEVVITECSDFQ